MAMRFALANRAENPDLVQAMMGQARIDAAKNAQKQNKQQMGMNAGLQIAKGTGALKGLGGGAAAAAGEVGAGAGAGAALAGEGGALLGATEGAGMMGAGSAGAGGLAAMGPALGFAGLGLLAYNLLKKDD